MQRLPCTLAITACLLLLFWVRPVAAHPGLPPAPHDLWTAWNWQPALLGGLTLTTWAYLRGVCTLWQRAGVGRSITLRQTAFFYGGLTTLFIALISPLDALSAALFSAHMTQHMLLIMLAAPLLVLSGPPVWLVWAMPPTGRRKLGQWWNRAGLLHTIWQVLSQPLIVWALHALALWLWHAPRFYAAALQNEFVHGIEHFSFFATALLFWWTVLPTHARSRLPAGIALLYLFTMAMQSGILGMLLTFAPTPWIAAYVSTSAAWGLTALADQQWAGLIMWGPMSVIYLVAILALLGKWLRAAEQAEPTTWSAPPLAEPTKQT